MHCQFKTQDLVFKFFFQIYFILFYIYECFGSMYIQIVWNGVKDSGNQTWVLCKFLLRLLSSPPKTDFKDEKEKKNLNVYSSENKTFCYDYLVRQ